MTDTKKSQTSSMQSSQQGVPSSSQYEYWCDKSSGKIWASKNEHGSPVFHGPLSDNQIDSSPEGFTYSSNSQLTSHPEQFDRLTYSQMKERINQQGVASGSNKNA